MSNAMLWKFGVPTEPDVKKLLKAWPPGEMKPGDKITKEQAADVLGVGVGDNRFISITNAWRKSLEPDIVIVCPGDRTFEVATESQKLKLAKGKMTSAVRMVRKSVVVSSWVDCRQLDDDERKQHTLLTQRTAAVRSALQIKGNGNPQPSLLE